MSVFSRFNRMKAAAAAALMIPALLFTGCTDERVASQNELKEQGIAALQTGDYAAAEEYFSEAMDLAGFGLTDRERDICFYQSAERYVAGDIQGAIERMDSLLAYDENDADAYFMRGSLYLAEGETESALADYDRSVTTDSADYDRYLSIYENLTSYGLGNDGKEYLNRALSIEGSSPKDYRGRAEIYAILGHTDTAITNFEKAVAGGDDMSMLYLAKLYAVTGADPALVDDLIAKYLSKNEEPSAEAYGILSDIELQRKNYDQALSYINQGNAAGEDRLLMRNEIVAYEYSQDFARARDKARSFVAVYPTDAEVQRELIFLETR